MVSSFIIPILEGRPRATLYTRARRWLCASLLLLWGVVHAQDPPLRFHHLTSRDGLSQSQVFCILQDHRGYMWFGTRDGLNRYDGYGFKTYRHDPQDPDSLSDHYVYVLYEDSQGILWIGTRGGLNRFDPATEQFSHYRAGAKQDNGLSGNTVTSLAGDGTSLWVGMSDGGLNKLDVSTGRVTWYQHNPDDKTSISSNTIWSLLCDSQGRLWVGTEMTGFNRLDPGADGFTRYQSQPGQTGVLPGTVWSLFEDREGILWVGTHSGLQLFDPESGRFTNYIHDPEDANSIGLGRVQIIREDSKGSLWIGTMGGGLNRFDRKTETFVQYTRRFGDPLSLSHNSVWSLHEDRTGLLWVGTFGGGVNRVDTDGSQFGHTTRNGEEGLSSNVVTCFYEDARGVLWIGTFGGGLNRLDPDGSYRHYLPDTNDPTSIADDVIFDIEEDDTGALWLGTFHSGLERLDPKTGIFTHYPPDPQNGDSLADSEVRSIYRDQEGSLWLGLVYGGVDRMWLDRPGVFEHHQNDPSDAQSLSHNSVIVIRGNPSNPIQPMWIGTWGEGLNRMEPSKPGRFTVYRNDPADPNSLSNNVIFAIRDGGDGVLWVGTSGGLNRMDVTQGTFRSWHLRDGMPNEVVYGILGDGNGFLWLSTNKGLSRFDPNSFSFRNYTVHDGLQGDEFKPGSALRARDGRLFFGGLDGFNAFFPDQIQPDEAQPQVVITEFLLNNQPVLTRKRDPNSPLKRSIWATDQIRLDYRQTVFGFDFAGLHYDAPEKNRYRYRLKGFNDSWTEVDAHQRRATYTHLDPATYTFEILASNKDNVWSNHGKSVQVTVESPPWKSLWAYVLYVLAISGLLFWYMTIQRQKHAQEQRVIERLLEVDKIKDEFLANTSHELRTPLNGIIGLAESLEERGGGSFPQEVRDDLFMIASSGRRLARLVDDILDFSRLKNRELGLRRTPVALGPLTDVILTLSRPFIEGKDLVLENAVDPNLSFVDADEDRLQQILLNLVGNAIKFTASGSVRVEAKVQDSKVIVSVIDTGIGIPKDKLETIFQSFEQAEDTTTREFGGTGLGLAITRKLVELHGGLIHAESIPGQGATFQFQLPIWGLGVPEPTPRARRLSRLGPRFATTPNQAAVKSDNSESVPKQAKASEKPSGFRLLIVDDEAVNRRVLINFLSAQRHTIDSATSGPEALAATEKYRYDLILLDVMMPRMSGYEVCRELRKTWSVRDLPIIFLTAKNQVADLVLAFAVGANDYLTKPIEKGELLARVKTHLELVELNRGLAKKVAERTKELNAGYRELEILDRIVTVINREMELSKVIDSLLEQGVALLANAERACFMLFDGNQKCFRFVAARGYDMDIMSKQCFTRAQLQERYQGLEKIDEGVFYAPEFQADALTGLPLPKSVIVMTIPLNGEIEGLMFLETLEQVDAFSGKGLSRVKRLRQHAVSAIAKAKTLKDLVDTRRRLMEAAHLAGRTEIVTEVLHNVGNQLNSVRTSAHMMDEMARQRRWIELLHQLSSHLLENDSELTDFLTNNPLGKGLRSALAKICSRLEEQFDSFVQESRRMTDHVAGITAVLLEQERHIRPGQTVYEATDLNAVVEESLILGVDLLKPHLQVSKQFGELPQVMMDKAKFNRVFYFLLKNAVEAISEHMLAANNTQEACRGKILLKTWTQEKQVTLEIQDNGIGIPAEHLGKVFVHGFTTKDQAEGFGLHYCANTIKEMAGTLHIESQGLKQGATVALVFPAVEKAREDQKKGLLG